MTSVDELFRKPAISGNKRKLDPVKDPNELYKSTKTSANGDAKGKKHSYKSSVEDEAVDGDEDTEAGPQLPPDEDGVQEPEDDEEGRFFGGGVSRDTADALDYIEERDGEEIAPEKIDAAWLKRRTTNFEKLISKNAELRAKFEDDPQKFMRSEADLDTDIKSLSILTDHPELYGEFAESDCLGLLVGLLAHENTDIAIDAIQILSELTDEDVQAEQAHWDTMVEAMFDADLPSLLNGNFDRFDESNESDRNGVYHSLSLIENLASASSAVNKFVESNSLLKWLLTRIKAKENPVTQNKQYAAEILVILLQSLSSVVRDTLIGLDAVDSMLQMLFPYRKKDPAKNTEEEEFVENIFDALVCLVDNTEGKAKFLEGEGVELCLIMLREGKLSKHRGLRVLDHACAGNTGPSANICETFVEKAGLKTIFGIFMKQSDHNSLEHVLGIFSSLLRQLPGDSAPRIRVLAKFLEKDYEKVLRLLKLRHGCREKLGPVEEQINSEKAQSTAEDQDVMADEWLSRRLDAGFYNLQTLDVILAWLIAEDDGACKKIVEVLAEGDEKIAGIKASLQEQLDDLDASKENDDSNADMLNTLIDCLE